MSNRDTDLPQNAFSPNVLPPGAQIGEYRVVAVLGEGGFGIVYRCVHSRIGNEVAIKEYMPAAIASRIETHRVSVRSGRHRDSFAAGLRSFVNEAQLLTQFDHPALVKVRHFWEDNGTAYMVMPYYVGQTLTATLAARHEPPNEAWIRNLLDQLLDALDLIHGQQVYHRDIAPDNIMMQADGRPVLLDFGAARRVISELTQDLTVILKPGFAPIEQYGEVSGVRQGPWTDLYALAATIYYCMTRRRPQDAATRIMEDKLVPLTQAVAGQYSASLLHALDRALAVAAPYRPQSVTEFRAALNQVPTIGALPGQGGPERPDPSQSPSQSTPRSAAPPQPSVARTTKKRGLRAWWARTQHKNLYVMAALMCAVGVFGLVVDVIPHWLGWHRIGSSNDSGRSTATGNSGRIDARIALYNAAVNARNEIAEKVAEQHRNYTKAVHPDRGPIESAHIGALGLSAENIEPHLAPLARSPASDDAIAQAGNSFMKVVNDWAPAAREADIYYRQQDYRDDKFARGRALHPKLIDGFDAIRSHSVALAVAIEAAESRESAALWARLKRDDALVQLSARQFIAQARQLIDFMDQEARKNNRDLWKTDPGALREFIDPLESTLTEINRLSAEDPTRAQREFGDNARFGLKFFDESAAEFVNRSKLLWRALRDPKYASTVRYKIWHAPITWQFNLVVLHFNNLLPDNEPRMLRLVRYVDKPALDEAFARAHPR